MADPLRKHAHLHLLDPETGEIRECPNCARWEEEAAGEAAEKRSWRTKYYALKRDKDAEAKDDKLWPLAVALFWEWKIATGHMRSGWTAERFFLCAPFLQHDGFELCRYAVWGISAHPNRKQITPTYEEIYDDFELVFRNRATFERYTNRGHAIFGSELPQPPVTDDA